MNMITNIRKIILGTTVVWTMIFALNAMALGNTDDAWLRSLQHARHVHVNKGVMTDAKPIGEEFGRKCLEALRRYYGEAHIPSDLVILKHSPVMELPGFQDMQIAIIDDIIHVHGDAMVHIAHEIRHMIDRETMGTAFYGVYVEAHTIPSNAGHIFEQLAHESERGFLMSHGPVCEVGLF